jgi:hypothetical protein
VLRGVIKFVEQGAAGRRDWFAQAEQLAMTMLAQLPPTAGPTEDRAVLSMVCSPREPHRYRNGSMTWHGPDGHQIYDDDEGRATASRFCLVGAARH